MNNQDKLEIAEVLVRYATGIDQRDWKLFSSCFTEDVQADYGDFGKWQSVSEITQFMEEVHKQVGATLHRLSNIVIETEDTTATARSYVDALLMPINSGDKVNRGIGYYDDDLVKTPQGWKICKRRFSAVQLV